MFLYIIYLIIIAFIIIAIIIFYINNGDKPIIKNENFHVITLSTPNYDKIGCYGANSLKKYCDKHGYKFTLYRKKEIPDLHVNFTKKKNDTREKFRTLLRDKITSFINNYKGEPRKKQKTKNCNFNLLISKIFYINLDHRLDRKKTLNKNLIDYGFNEAQIIRFPAVYEKEGARGCLKSHYFLVKNILEIGSDNYYIIMEDDFVFNKNFEYINSSFCNFLKKVPEWDVFLLTCNSESLKSKKIVDNIYQVERCQVTAGYIVNVHYLQKYFKFLEIAVSFLEKHNVILHEMIIDIFWQNLQKVDKWYTCLPLFGAQTVGYSDIEQKNVDYTKYS